MPETQPENATLERRARLSDWLAGQLTLRRLDKADKQCLAYSVDELRPELQNFQRQPVKDRADPGNKYLLFWTSKTEDLTRRCVPDLPPKR